MALDVMIVDNEASIRKGLAACVPWEDLGCRLAAQAGDGIEALEMLAQNRVDIVVSDIRMPGMDGLALAESIARQYPETRVILLTGYPDFDYAQKAIACGVVDFVLKPLSLDNLKRALERAKRLIVKEQSHLETYGLLASQSEQNLALQRSLFLNELIHSAGLSILYTMNRLAQLRLNLESYFVLRIMVSNPAAEDNEDIRTLLDEAQALIMKLLAPDTAVFIPRSDHTGYIVVCTEDAMALAAKCREAAEITRGLLYYTLSIGVSRKFSGPLSMPQAAQEARQAQEFATRDAEVICFGEIPNANREELSDIVEYLKALRSAVDNPAYAEELLEKAFAAARRTGAAMETARSIAAFVYNFWAGMLFERDAERSIDGSLPTLESILNTGAGEDMENSLLLFMRQVSARILENSACDGELIGQVTAYIEQRYAEELSLERLADMAHMSPSYFSRLFKKETGRNLSVYIQSLRIEKAKALLAATQLKSYEVAERVGIPDPVYFSRLFKKVTGVKPKDYRKASGPSRTEPDGHTGLLL